MLTKPDTIQSDETSTWLDILRGRKFRLNHGYFITKNATAKELQAQRSEAPTVIRHREEEEIFFQSTPTWDGCPSDIKARFGSKNLTEKLSNELTNLIDQTYVFFFLSNHIL